MQWGVKMEEAENLTEERLDEIAATFGSVEECDRTCMEVFIKNRWSLHKSVEWSKCEALYLKRAAFVIMAGLAKSDNTLQNSIFRAFLPILIRESVDERDEIADVISWALKEIGKRNADLTEAALHAAEKIETMQTPSARRIGETVTEMLKKPALGHYNYPKEKYATA